MLVIICKSNGVEYLPERNLSRTTWEATVEDIASGEWTTVEQVIHTATGNDITGLVAEEVARIWNERDEPLADWQKDFLQANGIGKRVLQAAE